MFRDLATALITVAIVSRSFAVSSDQQPPANTTPVKTSATDPATVTFTTDRGAVFHAVKPGSVADYEAAITALQEALSKAEDPEVRRMAAGWRVLKSADADAKANVIFIHLLEPAIAGVDYRPSLWLDKLLAGAPAELLTKYRDSFATPPTKLGLLEFAKMSVAPVPKPGNASPGNTNPAKAARPLTQPGSALEREVHARVEPLIFVVQRAALQSEQPVVESQTKRTCKANLRAAAEVAGEVRLLQCEQTLAVDAAARSAVQLHSADLARGLEQDVARAGLQRRQSLDRILDGVGVLELEADDEQAKSE